MYAKCLFDSQSGAHLKYKCTAILVLANRKILFYRHTIYKATKATNKKGFLRKSRRFNDKCAKSEKWWDGNTKGEDPNESDDEERSLVRGDLIRVRTGDDQKSLNW